MIKMKTFVKNKNNIKLTRKLIATLHKSLHTRNDTNIHHVKRKGGDCGLITIEAAVYVVVFEIMYIDGI